MDTINLVLENLQYDESREIQGYCAGGEIYIASENAAFPAENWYDLPFSVLESFVPQLVSFAMCNTDSCLLRFMDGPYSLSLNRDSLGKIATYCKENHTVIHSWEEIDFLTFLRSIISCLHAYDRFLYENGKPNHFSQEIITLKQILAT